MKRTNGIGAMLNITLELLLTSPAGIALLPPIMVALAAFRRACLSHSRNFTSYVAVAAVAGVVCQVNMLFIATVPLAVLVISGLAVLALWLEVRARCDARRARTRVQRDIASLRSAY